MSAKQMSGEIRHTLRTGWGDSTDQSVRPATPVASCDLLREEGRRNDE